MWFGIEDKVAHQSISEPALVCTSGTALGPVGKQFGLPALLCTGKWPERCLRGGPDQPAQPHGASIPKASKPLKHGEGMVQEWLHGSHLPLCTLSSAWLHGLSWPTLRMLWAALAPSINLPDFNGVDV